MDKIKIANFLDSFYNQHLVNGATLFALFIAMYGLQELPQFKGNFLFILAMGVFFIFSIYEIIVKGLVVQILRKS